MGIKLLFNLRGSERSDPFDKYAKSFLRKMQFAKFF